MKNFIIKLLTVVFALTLSIGVFTACGGETPAHTHDYKTLKYDSETHFYECSCGEKQSPENHKGGSATCQTKAVCSVCNQTYGELGECNYENNVCTVCGESVPSEGLLFEENENGYTLKGIGTCIDTKIVIPSTYNNKPVTSIGESAFMENISLQSVVIPNSVTDIGRGAFFACPALTNVEIPSSVTNIADLAFAYCISLQSVEIPNGVTTIGYGAFGACDELTSIVIPNSVTSIGDEVVVNCDKLQYYVEDGFKYLGSSENKYLYLLGVENTSITSVTINSKCRFIGDNAFDDCKLLESVVIPNNVTKIGINAFKTCYALKNIVIPNSVTIIGHGTFGFCTSLTSIVIPNTVTRIDGDVFSGCIALKDIKYTGTEAQWLAITKSSDWNEDLVDYTITYNYNGN